MILKNTGIILLIYHTLVVSAKIAQILCLLTEHVILIDTLDIGLITLLLDVILAIRPRNSVLILHQTLMDLV